MLHITAATFIPKRTQKLYFVLRYLLCCLLYSPAYASDEFTLTHIGSTQIQIALTWNKLPEAQQYILHRSTSPDFSNSTFQYTLPASIRTYGDTGFEPDYSGRFISYSREDLLGLQFDTDYYYQVEAVLPENESVRSNVISARKDRSPIRNQSGDLWADIVLGQRNFNEYSFLKVRRNIMDIPGGIGIERRGNPTTDRVYVVDANHNRILGYSSTNISPETSPNLIIGQMDDQGSTCNGEQTRISYPQKPASSASSLCFAREGALSPGETVVVVNLALDLDGNLYVPDPYNHRILKYNRPFETDGIADEVWGQDGSFETREANNGGLSASSLSLNDIMGIDIDSQGNLWVVDFGNSRVLRFPKLNGVISKEADFVLGQESFTTQHPYSLTTSLDRFFLPSAVRVDQAGNVYVADRGREGPSPQESRPARVLKYSANAISSALASGLITVSATETLFNSLPDWSENPDFSPAGLMIDQQRNGLWVQSAWAGRNYFYSFSRRAITKIVAADGNARGVDLDSSGNLYSISAWEETGLSRFAASDVTAASVQSPLLWHRREKLIANNSETDWKTSNDLDVLGGVLGIALAGKQLLVTDKRGLLFWDDYQTLESAKPADGLWIQGKNIHRLGPPRVDKLRKHVWISGANSHERNVDCGSNWCLYQLQYPLKDSTTIRKVVSIGQMETKEGISFNANYQDFARFTLDIDGESVWLGTLNHGAVRLTNLHGTKDSSRGPYVDIMPGVTSTNPTIQCPELAASTICYGWDTKIDPDGNLFVVDHNRGMDGGGTRLLRFNRETLPVSPQTTQFGIPASAVYGTQGSFTSIGLETIDSASSPLNTPSFIGAFQMVFPTNPYTGNPFVSVNLHAKENNIPQLVLGDYMGFTGDHSFDTEGNLYVGDWNWNRVLVYKKPFSQISEIPEPILPPDNGDEPDPELALPVERSSLAKVKYSRASSAHQYDKELGTRVLRGDDGFSVQDLGFKFPYYGEVFKRVMISANGRIVPLATGQLAPTESDRQNEFMPGISPYHTNLYPSQTKNGGVWFKRDVKKGSATITWVATHYPFRKDKTGLHELRIQVKIYSSGKIEFHYNRVELKNPNFNFGAQATIGLAPLQSSAANPSQLLKNETKKSILRDEKSAVFNPKPATVLSDFDRDGKSDAILYRNGQWHIRTSKTKFDATRAQRYDFGGARDIPVMGEYDGDGKSDLAVFRPSTATWYFRLSSDNYSKIYNIQWGNAGEKPLAGDFDGDGLTELVVYQPNTGHTRVLMSSSEYNLDAAYQGLSSATRTITLPATPLRFVVGDFNGNTQDDFGVVQQSNMTWKAKDLRNKDIPLKTKQWGNTADKVITCDWDGDMKSDQILVRTDRHESYYWDIITSSEKLTLNTFGKKGDIPSCNRDFDGDGKGDATLFRPSSGQMIVRYSGTQKTTTWNFGKGSGFPHGVPK